MLESIRITMSHLIYHPFLYDSMWVNLNSGSASDHSSEFY